MSTLQKIHPNLWFDTQAEEAANFYVSIFPNSRIGRKTYWGKEGVNMGMKEGSILTIEFELDGQAFVGLNAGPAFKFNEAISFVINCADQIEVDRYWEKLNQGGDPSAQQCGWLKDKFGLSWQVVPTALIDMYQEKDRARVYRVTQVMMGMKKLDLANLKQAFNG